jgi:hypothetical protein
MNDPKRPGIRGGRGLQGGGALRGPALFSLGFLVLLASCAGGSGNGSWAAYPEAPARWDYHIGEIQVTVDHVREEGAASQIRVIAETLLAPGNQGGPGRIPLSIDIRVEQRSFLHSVDLLNTIYVDCLIRDGEGGIVGRSYQYSVGKRSVISSKEQRRLLIRALEKILRAQRERDGKTAVSGETDA